MTWSVWFVPTQKGIDSFAWAKHKVEGPFGIEEVAREAAYLLDCDEPAPDKHEYMHYKVEEDDAMPDEQPATLTIDRVMQGYQATKDKVELMAKRHAEEMKPLSDTMQMAKAWLLRYLVDNGLQNVGTDHGMAYQSTTMSTTVDPDGGWDKLLEYILSRSITRALEVIENGGDETQALVAMQSEPALALFNRAVNKTAVKELLEQNITVPGVKIVTITDVGVRKS